NHLKRHVVSLEKHHANVPDISLRTLRNRWKFCVSSLKSITDVRQHLDKQDDHDEAAAHCRKVDPSPALRPEIQQHNDKQEQNHDCSRIDQHLDDPDEISVK